MAPAISVILRLVPMNGSPDSWRLSPFDVVNWPPWSW